MFRCKSINCHNTVLPGFDLCPICLTDPRIKDTAKEPVDPKANAVQDAVRHAFEQFLVTGEGMYILGMDMAEDAPTPAEFEANELAKKYPQYYKSVGNLKVFDVYTVHQLFNIQDPSGCIQHASKKLLLSGVRTGNKSKRKDIQEARDTLTRWLDLNPEQ